MIIRIFKLLIKSKIILQSPLETDLIIFDNVSINELKHILKNRSYFVLKSRPDKIDTIYISPKIIYFFLIYFRGNLSTAYQASLIRILRPKIVITFIDNSFKFFDLARIFRNKITFLAIQNAARYDIVLHKHEYKKGIRRSDLTRSFFIPNFLCLGRYEIKHYKKHKINVKNFQPVGSLRLANFIRYINKNKIKLSKKKYDICLISEATLNSDEIYKINGFDDGFVQVLKHTIKFCKNYNKKFIFVIKRQNKQPYKSEMGFYKKYLTSGEYSYLVKNSMKKNKKKFSSYFGMASSKVVIGTMSTMLREKLSLRGKILVCNFTDSNIFDFPLKNFFFLKKKNYFFLKKKLQQILLMTEYSFFKKLRNKKNYIIEDYKKTNTIKKINKILDYHLKSIEIFTN